VPQVRDVRVSRLGQKLHYQAVAARTNAGGVLLVLRDVSKLVSAVQMKTDFVANASHELRTPIAAIKLAFDTLTEVHADDPQQTQRCIQIIAGHLKRLEDMLADLLDLSRVENENIKPEIAPLLAREPLAIVRNTMTPLAADRGVTLSIEADEGMQLRSDRRLLDLILKNLVENGIKYTPAGGSVRVVMRREHAAAAGDDNGEASGTVLLQVVDTGIGIPPQHLERVFERFYQVDAARSGSAGRGTGLGLAIVKHAVHALGGQVKIDSLVGLGTTVTCVLPDSLTG
jgi:two-component system phosphate regulon sensor histidine kinase PhoR